MNEKDFIKLIGDRFLSTPNKPAFIEGDRSITYKQLFFSILVNAEKLCKNTLPFDERPVLILAERNINTVIAIFSAIAAGKWYVPMDAGVPKERADALYSICDPSAVMVTSEKNIFSDKEVYTLEITEAAGEYSGFTPVQRDAALPMFGIFTSGSTGVPKLVVKDRGGIFDFIGDYCKTFGFTDKEVFGGQIPFYFDASTKDLFSTVYLGATLVIYSQQTFSFPLKTIEALNKDKITAMVCVPSILSLAAKFEAFSEVKPETLKTVLFVGERMPVPHLNYWTDNLKDVKFINLYGQTESAGNSCYYVVPGHLDETKVLPIGKEFRNSKVFLLDEGKLSDEGEICVSGTGLAICYYKDGEKTAAAFEDITIPEANFSGRIYHSGDFGRKDDEGNFICVSRKDAQIKHMGHRIELGDIEACALALSYISDCCCLYDREAEKIVLFLVCPEDFRKQVRKGLSERLPKYMIPHEFIFMDELPHNRNGKIDRVQLLNSYRGENNK